MFARWKAYWTYPLFRRQFWLTWLVFVLVIILSSLYLSVLESRRGTQLLDPFLSRLTPREFSLPVFFLEHSAMLISLILILRYPKVLLKALQSVSLLLVLRTITVYLFPLEPPHGMIYLQDPITGFFLNHVNVVTKDLFFSGHVAVMCLLVYYAPYKWWRLYLVAITPAIALMIMWQHVHYSLDVFAAPFFALFCCKVVDRLHQHAAYGIDQIALKRAEVRHRH